MPSQARHRPPRERSVFINCPFDDDYKPLFRAACFTVLACGFNPRCALDIGDSGAVRVNQIVELIAGCDFSLHDISRVQVDLRFGLPRFNMPLELGADLGLRLKGSASQKARKTLILDAKPQRYDQPLSDISGMDIKAHGNEVRQAVRCVRDWLNNHRLAKQPPPGARALHEDCQAYLLLAPDVIANLRLDPPDELPHADFMHVVKTALPLIVQSRTPNST